MITTRVDAVTKIGEQYLKTVIPAPPSVKIELTARCDLQCVFCASSHKLRERGDMDFSLFEKILLDLKMSGVKEIGLFYLGESLLYPRLVDAVVSAKEMGFEYVFLTTNGRLLTEDRARIIIDAGLDSIKFSFNAGSVEQYKEITGLDDFNRVVDNIKATYKVRNESGKKCGIYASSIQYEDEQLEIMKKGVELIRGSVDEHYWLPLYNQAGYTKGGAGNPGRVDMMRPILPCWQLFKEGHITWEGVLVGCCFAYEPKWDFGDLKKMSFMEAWNSQAAQEIRQANLNLDVRGTACDRCVNG
jgi:MoaA/NifB/PqqE/SkfB family radical SAM enzyme